MYQPIIHFQPTPNFIAYIKEKIGNHSTSILLDSGAHRTTVMTVTLGNLLVEHTFMVLDTLSTPVILGCDFLTNIILSCMDFSQQAVYHPGYPSFKL